MFLLPFSPLSPLAHTPPEAATSMIKHRWWGGAVEEKRGKDRTRRPPKNRDILKGKTASSLACGGGQKSKKKKTPPIPTPAIEAENYETSRYKKGHDMKSKTAAVGRKRITREGTRVRERRRVTMMMIDCNERLPSPSRAEWGGMCVCVSGTQKMGSLEL